LKLRSERQFSEELDAKFEQRQARFVVTSSGFGSMSGCYGKPSSPSETSPVNGSGGARSTAGSLRYPSKS